MGGHIREGHSLKFCREELMQRFRAKINQGKPIIGGGAGTGITAKCAEAGGIDLLVIYNSGRFRMAGRGSMAGFLAYGDANAIVMEMAQEVLPVVKHTPVLAGVNGTDPFRDMNQFLEKVKDAGFSGVQNFPTVGLIDGQFRQNLEETGMSYGQEVDMIRLAHEKGMLTSPYAFNEDEARAMTVAGADILVAHMGVTVSGSIGAKTAISLEKAAQRVQSMADAARSVRADVIVLCHGGPIAFTEDVRYILQRTDISGFYGASSIERLPAERAIEQQTRELMNLSLWRGEEARRARHA